MSGDYRLLFNKKMTTNMADIFKSPAPAAEI